MSAPADDNVVVRGDAERGGDVDDRFRHLDVRTRRRGIAARMVVHQDDRSIACCTCLRQLRHFSDMARCQTFGPLCAAKRTLTKNEKSRPKAASQFSPDDRGSSSHQCWLGLPAIRHEADTSKAEDHHRPC